MTRSEDTGPCVCISPLGAIKDDNYELGAGVRRQCEASGMS